MKISIVTITLDDGARLDRAICSLYGQELPNGVELEHVIVNSSRRGDMSPAITSAKTRGSIVINTPPRGVYAAINAGLKATKGDIIGMLHGSDYYPDSHILATVADTFASKNVDFAYGNINYVNGIDNPHYVSAYCADNYDPAHLRHGFAPPHPSLFVSRKILTALGDYKENYRIGADFDYFIRLFNSPANYRGLHIGRVLVNMDDSGISRTLYSRIVTNTLEKQRALKENGINVSLASLMLRYLYYFKPFRR